jgi:hypothetical protein
VRSQCSGRTRDRDVKAHEAEGSPACLQSHGYTIARRHSFTVETHERLKLLS